MTNKHLYFYSNHFGLVLTSCVTLGSIIEVTAATGRDCDFLYLHVVPEMGSDIPGRLTVKIFLEPLKLLKRRLNYLINMAITEESPDLEAVFRALIKMEAETPTRTSSMESWEGMSMPPDEGLSTDDINGRKQEKVLKPGVYIDKDLRTDRGNAGRRVESPRFTLPTQAVEYVPQGSLHLAAEKSFNVSPKALFHVLFGDKSAVWQLLQHQRRAQSEF